MCAPNVLYEANETITNESTSTVLQETLTAESSTAIDIDR